MPTARARPATARGGARPARAAGGAWLAAAALLALVPAPDARADEPVAGCQGHDWSPGIHDGSGTRGAFEILFEPSTELTPSAMSFGATLCGTDPGDDRFFEELTLTLPPVSERGEFVTCTRGAGAPIDLCDRDPDGDGEGEGDGAIDEHEQIEEDAFVGEFTVDAWCEADLCNDYDLNQLDDYRGRVFVDTGVDSCDIEDPETVACYRAEATGRGLLENKAFCEADLVTRKSGDRYVLTIHDPYCYVTGLAPGIDGPMEPSYIDGLDGIEFCAFAGERNGTACGSDAEPPVFVNGDSGEFDVELDATLSDGTVFSATASDEWRPDNGSRCDDPDEEDTEGGTAGFGARPLTDEPSLVKTGGLDEDVVGAGPSLAELCLDAQAIADRYPSTLEQDLIRIANGEYKAQLVQDLFEDTLKAIEAIIAGLPVPTPPQSTLPR